MPRQLELTTDTVLALSAADAALGRLAVREVQNYIVALEEGLRLLVRHIHGVLLDGVRGSEKTSGQFRRTPNWIGAPDDRPEHAVLVPPPVDEMRDALADWERFVNGDHRPATGRLASIRAQLHPGARRSAMAAGPASARPGGARLLGGPGDLRRAERRGQRVRRGCVGARELA